MATAVDGDTLAIGGERVRLIGVDAPEMDQPCKGADGEEWACGRASWAYLADLLREEEAFCAPDGRDRYGRVLAHCAVGGTDLGASLVGAGMAVAEAEYKVQELQARQAKRGIWVGSFERPSTWRRDNGIGKGDFDLLGWLLDVLGA